jgi:cytochrome oxidase Cu insertion factor (SCO1/SenC/PrrC family)
MKIWTTRSPRASNRWGVVVAALFAATLFAEVAAAHEAPKVPADFDPPAPGTYRLERIMQAPDGRIVDASSKRGQLAAYTHGKVTLLSLMYTACSDETGCPLAFYTIDMIKRDLEKSKAARGRVQVVSLSFDPEHDTPEVMRAYGGKHVKGGSPVPWHFLTAASKRELAPMLDGFGQDVSKAASGQADKDLMHVLKLFLIDKDGWVREIYTTST